MAALSPNTAPAPSPATAATATTNTSPVYAAFSPVSSTSATSHHRRTTLLVHQKSPLLVATPPQVTRALAYSHPFISPLNKFVGLLSWSTEDPWESFLMIAAFWAATLYGSNILRTTGPLIFGAFLIFGMWSRRFSPLSSIGWATSQAKSNAQMAQQQQQQKQQKQQGKAAEPSTPRRTRKETNAGSHHKSLEEIVQTLQTLTTRCNILLDPLLDLTDFLSTQHTATTATTRPALTALFTRLLFVTPIWYALTLPPLRLITAKRVVLTAGTLFLSWHSRPARVSRVILWRSKSVRRAAALITGLDFSIPTRPAGSTNTGNGPKTDADRTAAAAAQASKDGKTQAGIRFTFALYENQRRWLGIGWTSSMLAYERAAWTDEYLNPAPTKEEFTLPEVAGGAAKWRWCEGSQWRVEDDSTRPERDAEQRKRAASSASRHSNSSKVSEGEREEDDGDEGWIYYDNKWANGRRRVDGWGRYTRRRKWVRDAELVECEPETKQKSDQTPVPSPRLRPQSRQGEDDRIALPKLDEHGGLLTPDAANRSSNQFAVPESRGHTRSAESIDSNGAYAPSIASTPGSPTKEHSGSRSWWRRTKSHSRSSSQAPTIASTTGAASVTSEDDEGSFGSRTTREEDDEGYVPMRQTWDKAWVGDDVGMELG